MMHECTGCVALLLYIPGIIYGAGMRSCMQPLSALLRTAYQVQSLPVHKIVGRIIVCSYSSCTHVTPSPPAPRQQQAIAALLPVHTTIVLVAQSSAAECCCDRYWRRGAFRRICTSTSTWCVRLVYSTTVCRQLERPSGVTYLRSINSSSGEWGKIKLKLTTLPRIFIHVVCTHCCRYDIPRTNGRRLASKDRCSRPAARCPIIRKVPSDHEDGKTETAAKHQEQIKRYLVRSTRKRQQHVQRTWYQVPFWT